MKTIKVKKIKVSYKVEVAASDGNFFCSPTCPNAIKSGRKTCLKEENPHVDCKLFTTTNSWCNGWQFVPHECEWLIKNVAKVKPPKRKTHNWEHTPHFSHRMTQSYSEIKSPTGTPRFYLVRKCKYCNAEQYEHAAGKFIDPELLVVCQA